MKRTELHLEFSGSIRSPSSQAERPSSMYFLYTCLSFLPSELADIGLKDLERLPRFLQLRAFLQYSSGSLLSIIALDTTEYASSYFLEFSNFSHSAITPSMALIRLSRPRTSYLEIEMFKVFVEQKQWTVYKISYLS